MWGEELEKGIALKEEINIGIRKGIKTEMVMKMGNLETNNNMDGKYKVTTWSIENGRQKIRQAGLKNESWKW